MDFLKKLWPTPFRIKKGELSSFLVQLIIFVLICAVAGVVIGILSAIPILGIIFALIGSLMGIYCLIGIVLCILKYLGVM